MSRAWTEDVTDKDIGTAVTKAAGSNGPGHTQKQWSQQCNQPEKLFWLHLYVFAERRLRYIRGKEIGNLFCAEIAAVKSDLPKCT